VSDPELDTGQGQNLHLPQSDLLYDGPNLGGYLLVSVAVTEPLTATYVAGLSWVSFPNILSGSAILDYTGELTATASHTYTVTGDDTGTYPITADDRAFNQGICTTFTLVYDEDAPPIEEVKLSLSGDAQNVYHDGQTLFYGPQSSGTLTVTVEASDADNETKSGLAHATFPPLFGEAAQDDTTDPYQRSYPITTTISPDETYPLQAVDLVVQVGWLEGKCKILGAWETVRELKAGNMEFRQVYQPGEMKLDRIDCRRA